MSHVVRCSGYDLVKTDVVRAQDCTLTDAQGRELIDFESGVWCTALGHGHPRVNEVIRRQLDQVAHVGYRYTAAPVEAGAAAVCTAAGVPTGKCVFLSSGSEAVECGVQIARRLNRQPLLLTLAGTYLAAYGSAGRRPADEWIHFDWSDCAGCPRSAECDPACPRLADIPFGRIGGLAFEPGNSGGRVKLPPRAVVRLLAQRVRTAGGWLVVDEVTTGLGRTGTWQGYQHYGLEPDIVALGKGLGNGYPVSAVVMRSEVADALEADGFRYAQSHQNDPLAAAVAGEVIAVLEDEKLVERSARVGERFLAGLRRVTAGCPVVREVRGRGLMIALELVPTGGESPVIPVFHDLVAAGFMVGCKPAFNLLRFYPPLTIAESRIDRLLESLERILHSRG